jgi:hypothetical protein
VSRPYSAEKIQDRVSSRQVFQAGPLRGEAGAVQDTGTLPNGLARAYARIAPQITYTITSNGTPIAWLTGRNTWTLPMVDVPPAQAAVVERLVGA